MSKPLYDDPVVAEIHRIRAEMLAECGGDFAKLKAKVLEHEEKSGRVIIEAPIRTGAVLPATFATELHSPPAPISHDSN